jgi:hypothetical protein
VSASSSARSCCCRDLTCRARGIIIRSFPYTHDQSLVGEPLTILSE